VNVLSFVQTVFCRFARSVRVVESAFSHSKSLAFVSARVVGHVAVDSPTAEIRTRSILSLRYTPTFGVGRRGVSGERPHRLGLWSFAFTFRKALLRSCDASDVVASQHAGF